MDAKQVWIQGMRVGAKLGFVFSLLYTFAFLALFLFGMGLPLGHEDAYGATMMFMGTTLLVFGVGSFIGILPAILIGAPLGGLIAWMIHKTRPQAQISAGALGGLVGLVVAWLILCLAPPEPLFLWSMATPLLVVAGILCGVHLHESMHSGRPGSRILFWTWRIAFALIGLVFVALVLYYLMVAFVPAAWVGRV